MRKGKRLIFYYPGRSVAHDLPTKRPDLLQPHILRSLANVKATSIHTSAASCHCIVLDADGTAWLFGRNTNSALGVVGVDEVSENAPRRVTPGQLKAAKGTRFVHAACGRTHSLLVGSGGELWSVGLNNFGQVSRGGGGGCSGIYGGR